MWSIFLELSDLCDTCSCADDVEAIWKVFNKLHTAEGFNDPVASEACDDMYWSFYESVCCLEDFYNDGRWA